MKLPAASGQGIKADHKSILMMVGNVVSHHTPLPHVYPAASGRGIKNIVTF